MQKGEWKCHWSMCECLCLCVWESESFYPSVMWKFTKKQSFFLAFPSYSLKDRTLLHSGECRRAQQGNGVRYILQMEEQIGLIVNLNKSTHFMLKHYLLRHWNFLLLVTECNVWLKLETAVSFLCDVIVASCCLSALSFQGH